MHSPAHATMLAAGLGCGLMAGAFFAFSTFVMAGLDRLPAAQSIAAMQSMNRTAVMPAFMIAFVGTALLCLGLAVWAGLSWGDRRAPWVLGACVLYLVGSFGVTIAANVPLNDSLDSLSAHAPDAAREWDDYLAPWMAWNHVRTVMSAAAAALLTVALTQ